MQRRKLKPTLAKTGSAKENQPGRKERKRGKTEGKTKRRAKLTLQSNARNPLLQATCGHTATAHSRKDRRGGAELDHKYRFRKHPCANTCKTRGSTCFGLRQDFPSQPTQRPFWTKVAKTWKKNEILVSPTRGRRSANSPMTYETSILSAFWPPKKMSEVNIGKMSPVLQVFCRDGLQIAEQRVSKPQSTTKIEVWEPPHGPLGVKRPFLNSKMPSEPENRAFLAKSRPRNAGFEQKRLENGLLSAGFVPRWPPFCRTEGVKTAKYYK